MPPLAIDPLLFAVKFKREPAALGGQESPIFASMTFEGHTFAMRRLRGGANLVAVSGLLRHTSTKMSEQYLHVTRADLRAAVEAGQPSPAGQSVLADDRISLLLSREGVE